MKKLMCIFMALICSLGVFTATGCTDTGETDSIATVWCALSSEVFLQDQKLTSYPEAKLDVPTIKGETESRQIMITANKFIRGFDVETEDLVSKESIPDRLRKE